MLRLTMPPRLARAVATLLVVSATACRPAVTGPYRCDRTDQCPGGMTCDTGAHVCVAPLAADAWTGDGQAGDPAAGDPANPAPGCVGAGDCPTGYGTHDGCRCPVPPTGSAWCWDGSALVDCAGTAKPALKSESMSVRDQATGLLWSDSTRPECDVAGWRLPSAFELLGLVDFSIEDCPMVPVPPFSLGCAGSLLLRSSSADPRDAFGRLAVNLATGAVEPGEAEDALCVSGAPHGDPADRFVVTADGQSVVDRVTGLEWDRVPGPGTEWSAARGACEVHGGLPGWRIPTVTELYSLVRTGGGVTLLDPAFPSSPPDLLWSSTIRPGSCPAEECGSPMFYCVDFDSGKVVDRGAGERICGYRCVRTVDE